MLRINPHTTKIKSVPITQAMGVIIFKVLFFKTLSLKRYKIKKITKASPKVAMSINHVLIVMLTKSILNNRNIAVNKFDLESLKSIRFP